MDYSFPSFLQQLLVIVGCPKFPFCKFSVNEISRLWETLNEKESPKF